MSASRHEPLPVPRPMVVAIDMGYGHMRAAAALADALDEPLLACDRPPLADGVDRKRWHRWRRFYEWLTRTSAKRMGAPLRPLLRSMTDIEPLDTTRDLTKPGWAVRRLARFVRTKDLARQLIEQLKAEQRPLLTTYFAPAIAADIGGVESIYTVVTDSDIHRVWAPVDGATSRIHYFAPSERAAARLRAYGVRADAIEVTGFPLPGELMGGPDGPVAQANLEQRLDRIDPERRNGGGAPVQVTFAVGGAGTQADLAARFLPGFKDALTAGRLRLTLVAGVRPEVAKRFRRDIEHAGLTNAVEILFEPSLPAYFDAFNALLARTDVLWTKPSEMSFFAGLGLPILLAPPVGEHERQNQAWLLENGAALEPPDLRHAAAFVEAAVEGGSLAAAARAGFRNLPSDGLYRILSALARDGGTAGAPRE
ncbi:MAG: hypothetical protein QNJ98_12785 [Planctomycetota bacterium]|nr:hypothetical protein [Planctomycetota bacterium]